MNKKILGIAFLACAALNYSKAAVNFNNTPVNNINDMQNSHINMPYQTLKQDLNTRLTPIFECDNRYEHAKEYMVSNCIDHFIYFLQQGDNTFMPEHMQNITPQELFNNPHNYHNFIKQTEEYVSKILKNHIFLPNLYFYKMINVKDLADMEEIIEQSVFNFNFVSSSVASGYLNKITKIEVQNFILTIKSIFALEEDGSARVEFLPPMQEAYNSKGILGVKEALVKLFYAEQTLEDRCNYFFNVERGNNLEIVYNYMIFNIFYTLCAETDIDTRRNINFLPNNQAEFWRLHTENCLKMQINHCDNHILYRALKANNILNKDDKKCLILIEQYEKILSMFDHIFVDFIAQTRGVEREILEFYNSILNRKESYLNKVKILKNITNKKQALYEFLDIVFFTNKYLTHPLYRSWAMQIREAFNKTAYLLACFAPENSENAVNFKSNLTVETYYANKISDFLESYKPSLLIKCNNMINQALFNFNFVAFLGGRALLSYFKPIDYVDLIRFVNTLTNICALEKNYRARVEFLPPMQEAYNSKGICGVKEALVKLFYMEQTLNIKKKGKNPPENLEKCYDLLILNILSIFFAQKDIFRLKDADYITTYDNKWLNTKFENLLKGDRNYLHNNILYGIIKKNNILSLEDGKFEILLKHQKEVLSLFDNVFYEFTRTIEKMQTKDVYKILDLVLFPSKYLYQARYEDFADKISEAFSKVSALLNKKFFF